MYAKEFRLLDEVLDSKAMKINIKRQSVYSGDRKICQLQQTDRNYNKKTKSSSSFSLRLLSYNITA